MNALPVDTRPPPRAGRRRYLLCPPEHFAVEYAINPWMDPAQPVDRGAALRQWEGLAAVLRGLGHRVELLEPEPGLPDMVFTANGATVVAGRVLVARFRHPERAGESAAHLRWFTAAGFRGVRTATEVNEGEGDLLVAGPRILAASGFRTTAAAHREAQRMLGLPVVTLELTDPRYYHLDTALAVLDHDRIMYYPQAFSPASRRLLRRLYPDAILARAADAAAFGLNAVSDGRHVVLPDAARGLAEQLRAAGFEPVPVAVPELRKAGGGPKCCVLELRSEGGPS
ncbi:dimethylargininase [Kitasatospora cheerisanensis]|uniref:Amidinotransferase n=1 Tax=Kitasatospora cheerisanensis KCTC 2395 TaxID=1348663 RepID=A0A066Z238_9ACTN|nr:dimethylargininase [Kitasatospora cheerisanensis]KDN87572.1 amidinotransferase [Kitasatospora cheerisanensis KCTC 2395]